MPDAPDAITPTPVSLTAEQAAILLKSDLRNLTKKLQQGKNDFAIRHDEIGRLLSSFHDLADQESTQGQSTRLCASHRLAENTKSLELCQQVCRAGRAGKIETSAPITGGRILEPPPKARGNGAR